MIGPLYEGLRFKTKEFPLFPPVSTFTDDSVLTVAVAEWLLHGDDLVDLLHRYTASYRGHGYGGGFQKAIHGAAQEIRRRCNTASAR